MHLLDIVTDDRFARQMEIALQQSLIDNGLALPSPPPNRGVQIRCHMKEEPLSPPHSHIVQIGCHVKKETTTPPRRHVKEEPLSPPLLGGQPVMVIPPHRRSHTHVWSTTSNVPEPGARPPPPPTNASPRWCKVAF